EPAVDDVGLVVGGGGDDGAGRRARLLHAPRVVLPLDVVHYPERLAEANHHQREVVEADGQKIDEHDVVERQHRHGPGLPPGHGSTGSSGPRAIRYRAMSRTVGSGSASAARSAACPGSPSSARDTAA